MNINIKFGTSGYRGIIGKDFTIAEVEAIANAVAKYLSETFEHPKIVIGYDPRSGNSPVLLKGSFTQVLVDTFTNKNIEVLFPDTFIPTPVISWLIKKENLSGGLILTASHNPPEYNGIKFNPSNGAPAPTETTKIIEEKISECISDPILVKTKKRSPIIISNTATHFAEDLIKNITNFIPLSKKENLSSISLAIDAKHGTVSQTWIAILKILNIENNCILNAEPRSDFGNINPNPTKLETLIPLKKAQQKIKSPIAISNDPDGDRHVILNENGDFVSPEIISAIILEYFIKTKKPILGIATTIASSRIIKQVATKNKIKFLETPVGFKYFAPFFQEALDKNKISFGVESSGGFSASFHTFEKCGFLPCLLILLIIFKTSKSLSQLKQDLFKKYGETTFLETEHQFLDKDKPKIIELLKNPNLAKIRTCFQDEPTEIVTIDGLKIVFKNQNWVLMRLSGTEPLARIYAEANSLENANNILETAKEFLKI
jgi:phosphoglucomutase